MLASDRLRSIKRLDQLIAYLRDELDWPIDSDDVEEISYSYEPEELGLDAAHAAKINQIKQIRPHPGQPWGIFWVSFEKKRLPVVVLRRILANLVVKSRASANSADRPRRQMNDLLFISAYGDEDTAQREIAFAHFKQNEGDLPTLHVIGWDGADTDLKLDHVAHTLAEKLHWPKNPADTDAWRAQWNSAFRHRLGHAIRTADHLAEVLAALARNTRDAASNLLAAESLVAPEDVPARGSFHRLTHLNYPALPFDSAPGSPVYWLGTNAAGYGIYLIDDSEFEESSRGAFGAASRMAAMLDATQDSGSADWPSVNYSSTDLWLEITNNPGPANFQITIHTPETNGVYDLFMATNLVTKNWVWLLRTEPGQTNVPLTNMPQTHAFFILGGLQDSDADGLTDAYEVLVRKTDPQTSESRVQSENAITGTVNWMLSNPVTFPPGLLYFTTNSDGIVYSNWWVRS